jgi:Family of unknown function (DUF6498)
LKLLTPLFARHIAAQLSKRHPGLGPEEIGAMMRADLGAGAKEEHLRLVDAVVARIPRDLPARPAEKPVSVWVLVAANILPLIGVLFWGWDVFPLLLVFWMENVVIGVLNVLKMLFADPADVALWAGKLFMVPFFCVHYGMFTAVHGVFVLGLFGGKGFQPSGFSPLESAARAASEYGLWLPIAVLAGSHLFSFVWNYFYRGEFRRASLAQLMMKPYGRIIVLHVTLLLGGFGAMALGSPLWALLLLIALKIGLDLKAHVKEHSTA